MIKLLAEAFNLYFSTIGDQINERKLENIQSSFRRTVVLVGIVVLTTVIFPMAVSRCLAEEIVDRFRRPWRVELLQNGRWCDQGGCKSIEKAVEWLSVQSKDTDCSWRIRRGNEIFPGEIVAP